MLKLVELLMKTGHFSRRDAERVIRMGKVKVDGKVVRKAIAMVDPKKQRITFKGFLIDPFRRPQYIMYYKPKHRFLVPKDVRHLLPLEYLDEEDEGIVILTNDAKLHEAYRKGYMKRTYLLELTENPPERLKLKGLIMSTLSKHRILVKTTRYSYREIKEMFKPKHLKRIEIEPIMLDRSMKPGMYRKLTEDEVLAITSYKDRILKT